MRLIDRNFPNKISNPEFEDIFSGYVGLAARIKYFYQNNSEYIDAANSMLLKDLQTEIADYQLSKNNLDSELENIRDELVELKKEVEKRESEAAEARKARDSAKADKEAIEQKAEELNKMEQSYRAEENRLRRQVNDFESDINKLTDVITRLKEQYAELTGYYEEFERVRTGIEEEGYVDIADFKHKAEERINEGNELMKWSDGILKSVLTDVEAIKERIEKKRKPGTSAV